MGQSADEIPENSIIIGRDILGGLLVLINSDDGGVYYWDCAFNFESSTEESNAYYMTDSFSAFYKIITASDKWY